MNTGEILTALEREYEQREFEIKKEKSGTKKGN